VEAADRVSTTLEGSMPLLLLLLLILVPTVPLASQTATGDLPSSPAVSAPAAADAPAPTADHSAPSAPLVTLREAEAAEGSAAQPTVQGFLYHVFLTAVTALVTALVWRAVF
jgi:hypothetical protein